jgi:integrase
MATVELKHLHIVTAKGKTYVYAWRGGPRVETDAEIGTPAFFAAYQEVVSAHRIPDTKRFRSIIVRYRASPEFARLADSTKRNWRPWLDKIDEHFGELKTRAFDKAEKAKPAIRKWRGKYAETPRTADYGLQVLSRLMAYAVDPLGELGSNPCEGVKQLYSNSRADIIWTDDDIAKVKAHCSDEVAWAVDLAAHTGLRAGDLVKLSWSHVGKDAIIMRTGKSRGRKEAIVPLYPALRDLLGRIPKRSLTAILTSSLKKPWNKDGLSGRFAEAKGKAWPEGTDLNFNDLRGTAATRFYIAGFTIREIAEMMGWEEDSVDRIIRRYVSLTAALKDRIKRLSITPP